MFGGIFGPKTDIDQVRYVILSQAKTEEDACLIAQRIIQQLSETNWKLQIETIEAARAAEAAKFHEKMLNTLRTCNRCKKKFKYRDMRNSEASWEKTCYCAACYDIFIREHTYTCPRCDTTYLSQKPKKACTPCLIKDECEQQDVILRHLREARKRGRPATLTLKQWLTTLQFFEGKCAYCQEQPYEVLEHFTPLAKGGGTTVDNCVPACHSCNKKKYKHDPLDIEWEIAYPLEFGKRGNNHYPMNKETMKRISAYLDSTITH